MDRTIKVGETDAVLSRVYFDIRLLDNVSPALGENGLQPQVSVNGGAPADFGISTLTIVGFGRYTAQLQAGVLLNVGDVLTTRYARTGVTGESRGDTFLIVDNAFTTTNQSGLTPFDYYGTLVEADQFFSTRVNVPVWKRAAPGDKLNALRMATMAIDNLNIAGLKADDNQVLQFPRRNDRTVTSTSPSEQVDITTVVSDVDTQIPPDIRKATYLCAYRFLDGWDMDLELENTRTIENKFGGATSRYDPGAISEWIKAGIPSGQAWLLIRPYLRDPYEITLSRGN
jgi:hypothetical protein